MFSNNCCSDVVLIASLYSRRLLWMVLGPNEQPPPANASITHTKQTREVLKSKQSLNAETSLSRMESMNSLLALLRKLKPIEFVSTVTTIHVHGVHRSASIFDYNLSTITKSIWWGFRFFNSNAICRTAQPVPSCVARNRKFQNRKFLIIRRETRDFLTLLADHHQK